MHPAVEEPGLAMQRPLQRLAQHLIKSGEAAWYNAAFAPGNVPVVAHVAVGPEAVALAAFIDKRRSTASPPEKPLAYDADGLLAQAATMASIRAQLQDVLDFLGQLRANLGRAGDAVVEDPGLTTPQKLATLTCQEQLDVALAMVEDYVHAVAVGDRAKVDMYRASARTAAGEAPA